MLETLADLAAIVTAAVATVGYGLFRWERYQKRRRLESYLRQEKLRAPDESKHTLVHLMAELGMSESDLMDAAFRSDVIARRVSADEQGHANKLLLEYSTGNVDDDLSPRRPGRAQL